jgi:putative hemolysin
MVELQPDGSYLMSGMAPFDEVVEVLGIPLDEEDDFETLNGFLISLIDKIPSDDEVFSTTAYGYLFENKMIQKVHVIKLPEEKASEVELADGTCQNEE